MRLRSAIADLKAQASRFAHPQMRIAHRRMTKEQRAPKRKKGRLNEQAAQV
jgi:hypothetical protein